MVISEEQKKTIECEFNSWTDVQYAGKDKKERQKLGQFFTPPPLTIRMIEKFDSITNKDILDPTSGAGGLLVACLICGADPNRIYGIELDLEILKICRRRLLKYGVPPWHLIQGDALQAKSYEFDDTPVPQTFAVLDKIDNAVMLTIVMNSKVIAEKKYLDKDLAAKAIASLKQKNIFLFVNK